MLRDVAEQQHCLQNYYNKLLVITSPKVICPSLWATDIDTCRKRSSTILWESGSKSALSRCPRILAPNMVTFDIIILEAIAYKVMEGSKSAGDPNPRLGSSKSASVFGWGIQIRGDPNPRLHMHVHFFSLYMNVRVDLPKLMTSQITCAVEMQLCIPNLPNNILGNTFSISTSIPGWLISESKTWWEFPFKRKKNEVRAWNRQKGKRFRHCIWNWLLVWQWRKPTVREKFVTLGNLQ